VFFVTAAIGMLSTITIKSGFARFRLFCRATTVCSGLAASCILASNGAAQDSPRFYIRQYRVDGAKLLKSLDIEEAVYPFLGPGRTPDDVEKARQTLEKAYHDKGFQTVSVIVPQQDPRRGVIRIEVSEGKLGHLRVNGAKWFLPSRIKREIPSLAEGTVPNLTQVGREMVAVNRLPDRRITPELRSGMEPGTVDIDLNVEDEFPLHGSFELNNRYSADTTKTRFNGSLSYGNLFQLGHTLGLSFQIAPENIDDAKVLSGYYLARISDNLSLMVQGTKQNSDVSTITGAAVGGNGETIGARIMVDLPNTQNFYQTFSFGIDYKNYSEDIVIGPDTISSPIEYYPLSTSYYARWSADKYFTDFNAALTMHLRGMGSSETEFANKRYGASGAFCTFRADASHTRDIVGDNQVFVKIQGQISGQSLINNEQIAGGGLSSVRGYLEATSLGDSGVFTTLEVRSPTLIGKGDTSPTPQNEWRFHGFAEGGVVDSNDTLPGQDSTFWFGSVGLGTRIKIAEHYNGSLDLAFPLVEQLNAEVGSSLLTFRGWVDF
jgi:hemolysin activation/secretion protein